MTTTGPSSTVEASTYQQLRAHLATLKLAACAEALPTVLDQAHAEGLSMTATLERLFAIEVDAEARRARRCPFGNAQALQMALDEGDSRLLHNGKGRQHSPRRPSRCGSPA